METSRIVAALPHTPGVYIYRDKHNEVIYVGKAKDLKRRVSQYFARDDAVGPKTPLLVSKIARIRVIKTSSEFDALLLEAKLIREYKPKYNVVLKDDKSPLYIVITLSEILPHVIFIRRSDIEHTVHDQDVLFGPFQSGRIVRSMLRHLRHTIPFCTQNRRTGTACFYTHIGLCAPCPSVVEKLEEGQERSTLTHLYRQNIFRLRDILSGEAKQVLFDMEKEMKAQAGAEQFEEAAITRTHIENLYQMIKKSYDPSVYITHAGAMEQLYKNELTSLRDVLLPYYPTLRNPDRIECVDISNTGGAFATGSLVVLSDGVVDRSQYRRFKIRGKDAPNDFAMVAEVITRRFNHPEWQFPDLLVIDGGKGQLHAAQTVLQAKSMTIPVIGLAKRYEEIVVYVRDTWKIIRLPLTSPALHVLERLRDESHRFALTYHRKLRSMSFLPEAGAK
ncbi:MAG TPA: GIY-YIG nuclease family protein [Patescibacteria group bacterium]|nr:GIY-YIG nuclease family protein [Patescibacteria group bacterium]